ncbi:MAG: UDP-N-acetylglucosamine 1-carboxyvinyltransferase [Zetaproteobacteria bacterium CG12_big_fil_rev_8_21_14_0_65_54_13]|nr:MAG: UDP-N-acetylglucosamine 1-carboxyvinyltransferase [Zetaproteobacteria bacterium CG23_combo_of_CG06-09_8_20_14_all_54_7]PIW50587.1 MAG: UDP-N-acetylglucosamine 1-carboxyvinyltransferase [Zetaproteobacteria bacterium CG12_big_fil_rev_8_21_14_0_65_54_13]PIX54425.1 MAG: UDP-N-acetylglucosamine 1-carboxyvinyltransferase [Zetaproteobacteria bacterium CG_4_10_14_3_um_filter_54_28]PJA28825.1 MAG: UDP-N-acetylglucosamine 1-carboxyvinyltransferase [Zetaproteobacteria bacterium CG_4_9_14_3_um_filte
MDKIIIQGGVPLSGTVKASGAKNAALPLLAAAILVDGPVIYRRIPHLHDISTMMTLLAWQGADVTYDDKHCLHVDTREASKPEAPYELVKTMRASSLVLGPLLARFGRAVVSLPGGCAIGARPIDMHLRGLEAMGASIEVSQGNIIAHVDGRLHGAHIVFDQVTVTGTENLMMAAVLAVGETVLENAAREPEIVNLADSLCGLGAIITGAGTNRIVIQGVERLHGGEMTTIADRIETATYLAAGLITGGDVTVTGTDPAMLEAFLAKVRETGALVETGEDFIRCKVQGRLKAVDIQTQPHPGFPTDLQAQFMAMMTLADGVSVVRETIFENRFMHVQELARMGVDIRLDGNTAIVHGRAQLSGAPVMATDLRASASLVLAGLAAQGETTVSRVYHIDRGYERIEEKLSRLGARIERVSASESWMQGARFNG